MSLYVDIEKTYGKFHLKMKFESGNEVLALLGASGCGKSLTLKCIAGIETPDRGRIVLDDQVLFDSEKKINLPPQKRKVGYLFQQYALFPNMTVYQNVAMGLRKEAKAKKLDKQAENKIIRDMLEAMGLEGMEEKYPRQLSGGQQQRVALARILVNEPNILMLDEPFSALDSHLRFRLEQEVRETIHRFGKSVVLVSHNRDEVFRLSDKIAIVADGKLETMGDKHQVFKEPKTKNAAILTGCKNVSAVERIDEHHILAKDWNLALKVDAPLADVSHVGIRMKYIRGGASVDGTTSAGNSTALSQDTGFTSNMSGAYDIENTYRCKVVEVIENPFSYTVMLVRADAPGTVPIGWEMVKDVWEHMQTNEVTICIPTEAILLLTES